jgi:hypothetical protein
MSPTPSGLKNKLSKKPLWKYIENRALNLKTLIWWIVLTKCIIWFYNGDISVFTCFISETDLGTISYWGPLPFQYKFLISCVNLPCITVVHTTVWRLCKNINHTLHEAKTNLSFFLINVPLYRTFMCVCARACVHV